MRQLLQLFVRLLLRPMLREPVRTLLTVLSVALGVGVVLAIDLAGTAAAGSFRSSLESLTGKSGLLITETGGLDEAWLGKLAALPFDLHFAPRIEDFAARDGRGEAFPFIGLDFVNASQAMPAVHSATSWFDQVNPIWVGSATGFRAGQHVKLMIDDRLQGFTVAGVLPVSESSGESNVIVTDIGIAQRVTGKLGKLDSIDVTTPEAGSVERWRGLLRKHLPSSVSIEAQGARTDENRKMLSAFRWNLRVLSYIALVVGAFLIYNTISISVVRRRNEIGVLRAVGAQRTTVLLGFLAEAAFLSAVGSVCGLLLGRAMAVAAVRLIGNTVQALYVSSQPASIHLTAASGATGILLGVGVSLLAALAPAVEAARVAPAESLARGREEYLAAVRVRPRLLTALACFAVGAIATQLPPVSRQPIFAYISVLLLIVGTAAVIPGIVTALSANTYKLVERMAGVEALLAVRSLRASLSRTSVLVAALTTAIAMTASVAIMVGSFRETVAVWMDNQLKADFYLRPAGPAGSDRYPTMSPDIADKIAGTPGIDSVDRFRAYPISYGGMPAVLAGGESSNLKNSAATRFLPGENRDAILAKLPTGDFAVVSEPFANKHHVKIGQALRIPLAGATRAFKVLGIYYDYSTERGYVVLDRRTLLKYLPDPAESNLAVYLDPGANPAQVRRAIGKAIAGRGVAVFSNNSLREGAIKTFDQTFRITYALEAVAVIVAVIGVAGALLATVIDRRRELGLLRFLGAAQGQIRKIILCEAGLLGLLASVLGLALGAVLSLILIFVINKQSFGWTIQFHWPGTVLGIVLTGVYLATVLSALLPARVATRLNPIEVVHEE